MPIRIQKTMAPDWKLPANTVDVEDSKWNNPYTAQTYQFAVDPFKGDRVRPSTPAEQVEAYRRDITCTDEGCLMDFGAGRLADEHAWMRHLDVTELQGKDLACSCPDDQSCHADVLLALANAPAGN